MDFGSRNFFRLFFHVLIFLAPLVTGSAVGEEKGRVKDHNGKEGLGARPQGEAAAPTVAAADSKALAQVLSCAGSLVERGAGGYASIGTAARIVEAALAKSAKGDLAGLVQLAQ